MIEARDTYPFHAIRSRKLPKHLVIIQNGRIRRISELRVIRRSPEIELSLLLCDGVELFASCASGQRQQRAQNSEIYKDSHPFGGRCEGSLSQSSHLCAVK